MEKHQPNENSSKDNLNNDNAILAVIARATIILFFENLLAVSNKVEKSLVAAAGIVGGAALLSPIVGPTAATIGALTIAGAYIFLNVNKTSSQPEKESESDDDINA